MRPDEHKRLWDSIHSSNPSIKQSDIFAWQRAEFQRLSQFFNSPKSQGPLYPSKKSTKSKANGCGQILKNSHISGISLDNPPLKGPYVSIPERQPIDKEEAFLKQCKKVKVSHHSTGQFVSTQSESKDIKSRQKNNTKQ